ncbi:MAG: HEAT repeat domain-containing protein [Deltaproteobacteria bacterium]|nr:HEAT repeat domain-containing protein [Deltaproteobacteria bacterium]
MVFLSACAVLSPCRKKTSDEESFRTSFSVIEVKFIKVKDDSGLLGVLPDKEAVDRAVLKEASKFDFIEIKTGLPDAECSFAAEAILSSTEGKIYYQINASLVRKVSGEPVEGYYSREGGESESGEFFDKLVAAIAAGFRNTAVQIKISHSEESAVVEALKSPQIHAALAAIDECRERRLADCGENLTSLLKSGNGDILLRALGAVSILKVGSAAETVASIVDSSENPDILIAAMNALHDIGAQKSRAYLKDIAENHPSEGVRNYAKSLLSKDK